MSNKKNLEVAMTISGIQTVEAGVQRVTNALKNGFKDAILPLAGVAATMAGITEGGEITRQVLQMGRAFQTMKATTGSSIPDLIAIQKVLMEAGVGADNVGIMLERMQQKLIEAARDGGPAAMTFERLLGKDGLAKLSTMNAGEQFKAIGAAIAGIGNEAKRTNMAVEIFGRMGYQLAPAFANLKQFNASLEGSEFSNVMSRNAEMFTKMDQALERLAQQGKHLMAGVLDSVGPMISEMLERLGDIDLTVVGRHIGSFVGVIVQSIKDDRLPEMIGLLIEAGFELGSRAARGVMRETMEAIGSQVFAAIGVSLVNAALLFDQALAQTAIAAAGGLAMLGETLFNYFGNIAKHVFSEVVNFFAERLESVINRAVNAFNAINGKLHMVLGGIAHVSLGRLDSTPYKGFGEAAKVASESILTSFGNAMNWVDRRVRATQDGLKLLGKVTSSDNTSLSAIDRVFALMKALEVKQTAQGAGAGGQTGPQTFFPMTGQLRIGMLNAEAAAKERIAQIDVQLAQVENDFAMTSTEKYEIRKKLLTDEREQLEKIVKSMRARADLEDLLGDKEKGLQIRQEASGFDKQAGALGAKQQSPDPTSWHDQWIKAMTDIQNRWGSWAQQTAKSFSDAITSATDAISQSMSKVIMSTMAWKTALYQIGQSIMGGIIQNIIKMGLEWVQNLSMMVAKWIVSQITMKAASISTRQAVMATNVAASMTEAAAAAPNALLHSIETFGVAALVGAAAFAVAMAATGSFADGGYTGGGGKYEPAGIVHRGEFVMSADAVARIGLPTLQGIQKGGIPAVTERGSSQIHIWNDHTAMLQHISNNSSVQHAIVKVIAGNRHQIVPRQA